MKTLYIIRHSKSDWETGVADFDRGLNKRGERQSKQLGKYFKTNNLKLELIISSAAKRTILTSLNIAKEIGYPTNNIQKEQSIYEAHYKAYLPVIWAINNNINNVAIIGHNPGVSELVYNLTGDYLDFKTSFFAKINFKETNWENISLNTGKVEVFHRP